MIIWRNPQIAGLIEARCAFKSDAIISRSETRKREKNKLQHITSHRLVNLIYFTSHILPSLSVGAST